MVLFNFRLYNETIGFLFLPLTEFKASCWNFFFISILKYSDSSSNIWFSIVLHYYDIFISRFTYIYIGPTVYFLVGSFALHY